MTTTKALLVLLVLALAAPAFAQDQPQPPNPFAGFETIILANGLKVWYKRLPNDPNVSISVTVPYGSDQDPDGKEQLAHFTEHMLFSDHLGRTEEQIKREIDDRGGVRNGITFWDHTSYFVDIGKQHGLFALDWLYRILSPHEMDAAVVERQREPVAIEIWAKPRELFDWVEASYVNPSWLRPPDFWQKEFGLGARRDVYLYRSLHKITPDDLRWFYETYYSPSRMTLTVIGDLDRDAVLKKVGETFANLQQREAPTPPDTLRDPGRYSQTFYWAFLPNVMYTNRFKLYRPGAEQELSLIFLTRFLRKRLNDQLRFGDRKAVYGVQVDIARRGKAEVLSISGPIKESEFGFAREVIQREIEMLRAGSLSDAEFEADRSTLAQQLRVENSASKDLKLWVMTVFYDPAIHRDFPDLATAFEKISKAEVETFARDTLVRDRQVVQILYVFPLTQGVLVALSLVLLWLTIRVARRVLISPVDMARICYVARFQIALPFKIIAVTLLVALIAIVGRLLVFGYVWLGDRFIVGIESFWLQWPLYALMGALTIFLLVLVLAHLPRKLLLFDDRLVVKYLSYRSVAVARTDIAETSLRRFRAVWFSRRLWKCVPLTLGLFSPGVYLRRRNGWSYFFRVRNHEEFLRTLQLQSTGGAVIDQQIPETRTSGQTGDSNENE
ncbi:MAG: pitrilysin family protein [Acidobacteriota bacterium]